MANIPNPPLLPIEPNEKVLREYRTRVAEWQVLVANYLNKVEEDENLDGSDIG